MRKPCLDGHASLIIPPHVAIQRAVKAFGGLVEQTLSPLPMHKVPDHTISATKIIESKEAAEQVRQKKREENPLDREQ